MAAVPVNAQSLSLLIASQNTSVNWWWSAGLGEGDHTDTDTKSVEMTVNRSYCEGAMDNSYRVKTIGCTILCFEKLDFACTVILIVMTIAVYL